MTPETTEQNQKQETRYDVTSAVTCDLSDLRFDVYTGTVSLGSGDLMAFYLNQRKSKKLKSITEHDRERARPVFDAPYKTGVACPKCGEELIYSNPGQQLCCDPPRESVCCAKAGCGYHGSIAS